MHYGKPTPMMFQLNSVTAGDDDAKATVETSHNHVYFYGGVTSERCLAAINAIKKVDITLRYERITYDLPEDAPYTPIYLHINSFGGDLFAGFGFADMVKTIKSPVHSIAEGVCASAATLMAMACTKRLAMPNTMILIHQFSAALWGKHEEFKDEMVLQEALMQQLVTFYEGHSRMSNDDVRDMLKRDTWLTSGQALERGIVDEVKE